MSMKPTVVYIIPKETEKVAKAAFPKGNVYMKIYEELGNIYQDEQFKELFAKEGQPSVSPMRLALATIMQYAEGLSDRQAEEAIRARIDWKYLLCLKLTDPGFDHTVLSEFRSRLVSSKAETILLDNLLKQITDKGLLKRNKQRTDSTHILGAIRVLNRIERVGETLRAALNVIATVAGKWLVERSPAVWYQRYGKRMENYQFPKSDSAREQLASSIGEDGYLLLKLIEQDKEMNWLKEVETVKILNQMWEQEYENSPKVRLKKNNELESAANILVSPYDVEARWTTKRGGEWTGYKVHITETCEKESPNLITQVLTTVATTPDNKILNDIHKKLEAKGLLPEEHLADKGYIDSQILVRSQNKYQVKVIGEIKEDSSWQAKEAKGFDKANFVIDWQREIIICPKGKQSVKWKENNHPRTIGAIKVKFAQSDCRACQSQGLCTKSSEGREIFLLPKEQQIALYQRKAEQNTLEFKKKYDLRAGIEGTISQAVRRCNIRQARYIGLAKTHLQMVISAVSINFIRLAHWFFLTPKSKTRLSPFAKLQSAFS
jgi:transposase